MKLTPVGFEADQNEEFAFVVVVVVVPIERCPWTRISFGNC